MTVLAERHRLFAVEGMPLAAPDDEENLLEADVGAGGPDTVSSDSLSAFVPASDRDLGAAPASGDDGAEKSDGAQAGAALSALDGDRTREGEANGEDATALDNASDDALGQLTLDGSWRDGPPLLRIETYRFPVSLSVAVIVHAALLLATGGSTATARLGAGGADRDSISVDVVSQNQLAALSRSRARKATRGMRGPLAPAPGSETASEASKAQADSKASPVEAQQKPPAEPKLPVAKKADAEAPEPEAPKPETAKAETALPEKATPAKAEKQPDVKPHPDNTEVARAEPALRPATAPEANTSETPKSQQEPKPEPAQAKPAKPAQPEAAAKAEPPPKVRETTPVPSPSEKTKQKVASANSAPTQSSAAATAGGAPSQEAATKTPDAAAAARLAAGRLAKDYSGKVVRSLSGLEVYLNRSNRARQSRLKGAVLLLLTIGYDGLAKRVRVVRSSGEPELDRQAVRDISRFQFPPAPEGLSARQRTYRLPITYR